MAGADEIREVPGHGGGLAAHPGDARGPQRGDRGGDPLRPGAWRIEEDRVEALREGLAASELPPIILARETPLPSLAQVQSMLQPGDTGLVLLGPGQFTPVD